jgi:hypothetical protein
MLNRLLCSIAILPCLAVPVAAQTPKIVHTKTWTAPLTRDGHPNLQGTWRSKSATPLERPKELEGRQFLTDDEIAEFKRRADRIFKDGRSDFAAGDNFFIALLANPEHFKSSTATGDSSTVDREFDNRTSLITDPPDGKLPSYTALGQQRRSAFQAAAGGRNGTGNPEDLNSDQRCITFGVPMLGNNYSNGPNAYYQIVQAENQVMIFTESIHDARIIPMDGRPHLPTNMRTWNGDSRGRWDGNTLVVDTTNFSAKTNFMGAGEDLHLVERFTRVAPDEIHYEIAIDAPNTWTRPWTAMVRLKHSDDMLYEFACHEGNVEIMETMLIGARAPANTAGASTKDE